MLGFTSPPRSLQTGTGFAPPVIPLRTIVTDNRLSIGRDIRSETAAYSRWQYVIASAASQLCVSNNGWRQEASGEQSNPNDFTIVDQSVQIGGVVVPVKYSGGRSVLITAGAVDVKSDALTPADFGLSEFSAGAQIYVKTKLSLASSGMALPWTAETVQTGLGQQSAWYNTANSTVSSTDSAGTYTSTGTTPSAVYAVYRPMVLGRPLIDGASFVTVGDSIAANYGDPDGNPGIHGGGYVQRAMHDALASTGLLPNLNLACSGSSPGAIIGANTKARQFYKYARFAIEEYGTNFMNTVNLRTDLQSIWSQLRAEGIQKIVRMKFLPRSNSSDSYLTAANQTYNVDGKWQVGGAADLNNQWFDTLVPATLDVVVDVANASENWNGAGDRWKWRVNGVTTNYANVDNTHPSAAGAELVAVTLRPVIRGL